MDISQLIEFSSNHLPLVLAFLVLLGMLVAGEVRMRLGGIKDIEPGAATRLLNHENAVFVDMRQEKDFREGHIANALNVTTPDNPAALEKFRDRPIIVYCNSGQKSVAFGSKLRKQGFETVYNLKGGVLSWRKADLPLTRKQHS